MKKQQVLILIGEEICDGCGEGRDCGLEYYDCARFHQAGVYLDEYVKGELEGV